MELEAFLDTLAATPEHKDRMNLLAADSGSGKKTLLLLTCIDLRYPSMIHAKMEPKFHKLYDHVCLAGAGLSPVIDFGPDRKPHWQQTFLEHVAISSALHSIARVVVMDHRDCGAFRKFGLLKEADTDTSKETETHREQAKRLQALLKKEFPKLGFDYLLLPNVPHEYKAPMDKLPSIEIESLL
jgi:carbonic anhydrase